MANWTLKDLHNIGIGANGKPLPEENAKLSIPPPLYIWIPGNVPSQKNSQNFGIARDKDGNEITKDNGKKLTTVRKSKSVQRYKKECFRYYTENIQKWQRMVNDMTPPYNIHLKFVRNQDRRFDMINAAQIVQDLMVDAGWVEDDNESYLRPSFLHAVIDKDNPGVFIIV